MTARTNIHFQEKFFNNPFLSVMYVQKKAAGGLKSSASSSVRQQKATHRAGGPARLKNLCQRCTLEHPQSGAERSNLPANRSKKGI
jgi:hypothetical protein